jgi:peroxiredoxin
LCECWEELKNFEKGVKWMERSGYVIEGIDGRVHFVMEEEGEQGQYEENKEWEI